MLAELLSQKRDTITQRWFDRVIDTYPAEAGRFLRRDGDAIGNPVGQTIRRDIQVLIDELLQPTDGTRTTASLESLTRLRAVQDFAPSRAVGFVFELKQVLREVAREASGELTRDEAWAELDARIDDWALQAFDGYVRSRQRLCDIRVNEVKRAHHQWQRLHAKQVRPPEPGEIRINPDDMSQTPGGNGQ
jgi:hypothetical protein